MQVQVLEQRIRRLNDDKEIAESNYEQQVIDQERQIGEGQQELKEIKRMIESKETESQDLRSKI